MQKINFITPIVFEILKLKNPAVWLAESIFAFKHAHLKLHDQFVALTDMKLHAQKQFYTSVRFWDNKVLKATLGMPDHTHLNLHNQFITLIEMNCMHKINLIPRLAFEILKF